MANKRYKKPSYYTSNGMLICFYLLFTIIIVSIGSYIRNVALMTRFNRDYGTIIYFEEDIVTANFFALPTIILAIIFGLTGIITAAKQNPPQKIIMPICILAIFILNLWLFVDTGNDPRGIEIKYSGFMAAICALIYVGIFSKHQKAYS